jgi:UDP-N-acetylglucosamine 2-epimerase (non-hydrolysing)
MRKPRPLVVHVVGARPNYMKIAPVYAALAAHGEVEQRLIHTGQHYDAALSGVFFAELTLPRPHVMLDVGSGSHGEQTARALEGLERTFLELRPDLVVVPGDVNSTLAGALAAAKLQIPVCHVESGLRSFDLSMPEEQNRRVADVLSTLLLTHCEDANDNLRAEGIAEELVSFVGNTMIDTLLDNVDAARELGAWRDLRLERRGYILVTLHRPALVDDPELLLRTLDALEQVGRELPVVFPIHPRTRARVESVAHLNGGIKVVDPLSYLTFLSLEEAAAGVITDSGGVQEETTALDVPCFTLRANTERPVTISHGTNTLLGLDPSRLAEVPGLLGRRRNNGGPPLWDGCAGERAAFEIERVLAAEFAAAAA